MLFEKNHQITSRDLPNFPNPTSNRINASLGGIDKSDVPYIYHHLKKGCILQLHPVQGQQSQHLMYCVNYGSYRLGILSSSLAKRIHEFELTGRAFRLTISGIVKEKYLPPTAIDVELEWGSTDLAQVA